MLLCGWVQAADEPSGNSILDHCEFEQPEVINHYLPVFLEDPELAGWQVPLMDLILDREGKAQDAVLIGKVPSGKTEKAMYLAARETRFSPAYACGEPVEGFIRFPVSGYFYVMGEPCEDLSSPPIPLFLIPEAYFSTLRLTSYAADEKVISFILSIAETGEIEQFEGTTAWTRKMAEEFMAQLFKGFRFSPALSDGQPVPVKLAMRWDLNKQSKDERVLGAMHFKEKRSPLPVKPAGKDYQETKVFELGISFSRNGLMETIQLYNLLDTDEVISVLNAFRNWYLPPDEEGNVTQHVRFKLAFDAESEEALVLEREDNAQLVELPEFIKRVSPTYPVKARKAGLQGATEVIFVVGKDGKVLEAEATASSHPDFVASTMKAVWKWKFKPGKVNGKPVNMRLRIVIPYKFN